MSLLVLENIVKEYRNQVVLDGVSLRVERGERLALIGPNGAGKSTLLKIALGQEVADSGRVTIARNTKVGHLSQDLKDVEFSEDKVDSILHYEKVHVVEKQLREIESQLAEHSNNPETEIYQELMNKYSRVIARYEAMDGYTIETKIKKILLGLGLRQETLDTPVSALSGGEKMRVSVARILVEEPDLLILDEPTNHLDIQATEWFEGFLKKFSGGILFVSHDRYFLDGVATRVAELDNGNICVRSGNYSNYLEHKKQLSQFVGNEQKRLRWTIKNENKTLQGLKSRGKIKALKSREKGLEKLKDELKISLNAVTQQGHLQGAVGPKLKFNNAKHISKDIAWAEDLRKSFGEVTLFSGASFQIRGGERVGVIGPNGCGKSTLINMLLGKDENYQGVLKLGPWVKYAYMGQEVLFENEDMSLLQVILAQGDGQEGEARDHLARFQFYGDEVDKSIKVLSGGERVRLYLACVMLKEADCLILDEPTNHLDMQARDAVEAALKEFKGTIIAVTHDRYYLTHCVDKILEVENGKISTYLGNYDLYKQLKYGSDEENPEEKDTKPSKSSKKPSDEPKMSNNKRQSLEKKRAEIEAEIMTLEDKMQAMVAFFDEATPAETYREYEEIQKKVEGLYAQWDELIT